MFSNLLLLKSAEMSGELMVRAGNLLQSYLQCATITEELGWCMDDVSLDCLEVLKFILSLSETSQRAIELSSFIPVYVRSLLLILY